MSRSLIQLIKAYPMPGWVRADNLPTESAAQEILKLRNTIDELKNELSGRSQSAAPGSERLSQGDEEFAVECLVTFHADPQRAWDTRKVRWKSKTTWNKVLAAVAPSLIDEASEEVIEKKIDNFARREFYDDISGAKYFSEKTLSDITIVPESFDTFIVQMVALGVFQKSDKIRSIKDTATYWRLTPYGEKLMYELRAIPRSSTPLIVEEIMDLSADDQTETEVKSDS